MANPLGSNMGNNQPSFMPNNNMAQFKNMINMLKSSADPNYLIQSLYQSNPQFAQIVNMCNGKNPKDIFYQMCQQRNINPNDILNQLK